MADYRVAQLDEMEAEKCPCGWTRRAFVFEDNDAASMHMVDITEDAQVHYHEDMTEIYLVLEGEGHMELDGDMVPVKPMTAVFIPPGVRHRAVGDLRVVNVPIPPFDPSDEHFD